MVRLGFGGRASQLRRGLRSAKPWIVAAMVALALASFAMGAIYWTFEEDGRHHAAAPIKKKRAAAATAAPRRAPRQAKPTPTPRDPLADSCDTDVTKLNGSLPLFCESEACLMWRTLAKAAVDRNGQGLCFFTVVNDKSRYMDFVPLYAYFALAAYRRARVVVASGDPFPPAMALELRDAASLLNVPATAIALVHDPGLALRTEVVGTSSLVAALRFLYDDPTGALDDCTFVYTGDVDILIQPEPVSLLAFHARRMLVSGQPFDNVRRHPGRTPCKEGLSGERMTGLHMTLHQPYRTRTAAARRELTALVQGADEIARWCCADQGWCDEHILFEVLRRSGLNPGCRLPSFDQATLEAARPRHGIHFTYRRDWTVDPSDPQKRLHLCKHIPRAKRLFPTLGPTPTQMLKALWRRNCRSRQVPITARPPTNNNGPDTPAATVEEQLQVSLEQQWWRQAVEQPGKLGGPDPWPEHAAEAQEVPAEAYMGDEAPLRLSEDADTMDAAQAQANHDHGKDDVELQEQRAPDLAIPAPGGPQERY